MYRGCNSDNFFSSYDREIGIRSCCRIKTLLSFLCHISAILLIVKLFKKMLKTMNSGLKLLFRKNSFNTFLRFHLSSACSSSLKFNEEHEKMKRTVNAIIEKEINPFVDQWEKDEQIPLKDLFKKLGSAGLLGITRPTKYGGLELDYSYSVAFLEELGKINCSGVQLAISVHTDMSTPALSRFGSDELKKEFLAPSISGDRVSCTGVSEIHCGSDVAAITTNAIRKGDDLLINGGKTWITNGSQADWMSLLANTSQGNPHKNKSLICVPLDLPGIKFNKIQKLGTRSSDMAQFFFEDVRVPVKNIIGEEGMGFIYQMLQFQEERLAASLPVPIALSRTIQETIDYCKDRKAFGQPIIDNQIIHFTLAELQTEIEALRSLLYRSASKLIDGEDVTLLASMAKLKAGRLLRECNDKCLQYWGGMGYTDDVGISRAYRDGRFTSIAGGSDEIMLTIISKYMGTLPKPKKH